MEIKANFEEQGDSKAIKEFRGGISQLTPAITRGFRAYAIHAVSALTSKTSESQLFKLQEKRATRYKRFLIATGPSDIFTFHDDAVVSAVATVEDCTAALSVWVAKVRLGNEIAFLRRDGRLRPYQSVTCL
jgi:hypothetical protein